MYKNMEVFSHEDWMLKIVLNFVEKSLKSLHLCTHSLLDLASLIGELCLINRRT